MVHAFAESSAAPRADMRQSRVATRDGMQLALERYGDDKAPALVFAHGFGQTRHAWDDTASALAAQGWQCIAADARGHGESGWVANGAYDYSQFIDDLVRIAHGSTGADALPVLVGASMGGLIGLCAQALYAPLFRALILVDITPRWEPAGVARILGFMRAHPDGFADYADAADAIAAYLPHRTERKSPQQLRKLLIAHADGRLRWHWDPRLLDYIETHSDAWQAEIADAARRIEVPTLLISGARSDVASDATIAEFLQLVPHARHARVDATHMIAGDANSAFTRAVADFIAPLRCEESPQSNRHTAASGNLS